MNKERRDGKEYGGYVKHTLGYRLRVNLQAYQSERARIKTRKEINVSHFYIYKIQDIEIKRDKSIAHIFVS